MVQPYAVLAWTGPEHFHRISNSLLGSFGFRSSRRNDTVPSTLPPPSPPRCILRTRRLQLVTPSLSAARVMLLFCNEPTLTSSFQLPLPPAVRSSESVLCLTRSPIERGFIDPTNPLKIICPPLSSLSRHRRGCTSFISGIWPRKVDEDSLKIKPSHVWYILECAESKGC